MQNIGSVTPPIWLGNATLEKSRKLILDFWLFCLGIVPRWRSGLGQDERLVNLGHTPPLHLRNLSEATDHELILTKTNKLVPFWGRPFSGSIIEALKSKKWYTNRTSHIDQTKMIGTQSHDWIIGGAI